MRHLWTISALALLGGCASAPQVSQRDPYLGASKAQVVQNFGLPSAEQVIEGNEVMQYERCSAMTMVMPPAFGAQFGAQRPICDVLVLTLKDETVINWQSFRR